MGAFGFAVSLFDLGAKDLTCALMCALKWKPTKIAFSKCSFTHFSIQTNNKNREVSVAPGKC